VDRARSCLYVSDSTMGEGPAIWRFDLETGAASVWCAAPMRFPNGMALAPDASELYVAETFARRVVRLPIGADGRPGEPGVLAEGVERLPDGLAVDRDGRVYVACYEPSRLYRAGQDGTLELLVDDPEAHTLCHPTNCAFRGTDLFTANLGRWHLTRIPVGAQGLPLPV
jgi:gluconolactonase